MRIPMGVMSRTPPLPRRPLLKPSQLHRRQEQQKAKGEGAGGAKSGGGNGSETSYKPVIVSYFPQTLHNSVAGDLSSTSNLSMKYGENGKHHTRSKA